MKEERLSNIAYCGLNCRMCTLTAILPDLSTKLHGAMQQEGWEYFGTSVFPEFKEFWSVLGQLSKMDETCPMCKGGCGDPDCQIRKCAQERKLDLCAMCSEFPCSLLADFTARYPFLLKTNLRLRELGVEAWLAEQDDLVAKGTTFYTLADADKEDQSPDV